MSTQSTQLNAVASSSSSHAGMPSLARKVLIVAAIDGLILTPLNNNRTNLAGPQGAVKIDYKTKQILPYLTKPARGGDGGGNGGNGGEPESTSSSLEVHGIAGLLDVSPTSAFLIAITAREQVALIRQRPIYVVTDVALIPLSSQRSASDALSKARPKLPHSEDTDVSDDDIDDELSDSARSSAEDVRGSSSISEDVISRKGVYGRFAEKWFSKRGWTVDRRRAEGMSTDQVGSVGFYDASSGVDVRRPGNKPAPASGENGRVDMLGDSALKVEEAKETVKGDVAHSLTPKLLHTTRLLLGGSRSFFFSYEWDITRAWDMQRHLFSSSLPLHKLVDPLYFWNQHLQKPFIDAHQDHFIIPLMQGFVGQLPFSATATPSPPKPEARLTSTPPPGASTVSGTFEALLPDHTGFTLTLISRRSIRRAGLRYLRRGIDDAGNVANSVETEQLVATPNWERVFSYLQIRGSIPLFFQQSPYALKPKPVLRRTEEANAAAFKLHFRQATQRYRNVHVVSLVEKHGNEAILGEKYRAAMKAMMEEEGYGVLGPAVGFSWFDFHHECRGMRFENVKLLIEELGPVLEEFRYTEEVAEEEGEVIRKKTQTGVLRTNCMDCLDRTNVVQSAAARTALDAQLSSLGMEYEAGGEAWFDRLWADNGDAISKQYASTAALKGDFTRTRKRNYRGALTDFGLTLSRYFTNIVSDFFTQAAIDFLLGSVTAKVFEEFEEELMSGDPAISMSRLRLNAVELSGKIVIEDEDEVVRGGWTVLTPAEASTLKSRPFREVVILVTDKAAYRVGFDWALEKVSEFERVELRDIIELQWGCYIISTLASVSTDEKRNVGFVIKYRPSSAGANVARINTRSLKSRVLKQTEDAPPQTKFMAFKALLGEDGSEIELVQQVCGEIESAWKMQYEREWTSQQDEEERMQGAAETAGKGEFVVNRDIISLVEAKRSTGLLEKWGYSLRKSVWA